jgi:hypothetical protein
MAKRKKHSRSSRSSSTSQSNSSAGSSSSKGEFAEVLGLCGARGEPTKYKAKFYHKAKLPAGVTTYRLLPTGAIKEALYTIAPEECFLNWEKRFGTAWLANRATRLFFLSQRATPPQIKCGSQVSRQSVGENCSHGLYKGTGILSQYLAHEICLREPPPWLRSPPAPPPENKSFFFGLSNRRRLTMKYSGPPPAPNPERSPPVAQSSRDTGGSRHTQRFAPGEQPRPLGSRFNATTFAAMPENELLPKLLAHTGFRNESPIPQYLREDAKLFFYNLQVFRGTALAVAPAATPPAHVNAAAAAAASMAAPPGAPAAHSVAAPATAVPPARTDTYKVPVRCCGGASRLYSENSPVREGWRDARHHVFLNPFRQPPTKPKIGFFGAPRAPFRLRFEHCFTQQQLKHLEAALWFDLVLGSGTRGVIRGVGRSHRFESQSPEGCVWRVSEAGRVPRQDVQRGVQGHSTGLQLETA